MPTAQVDLESLLPQFISRDPNALNAFPRSATPILKKLARRFAPELPRDLIDEIVQETYCALLNGSGHAFDAGRGTARKFFFGVVLNATQKVRASYCPPGTRTRKHSQKNEEAPETEIVPFDETVHSDVSPLIPPDIRSVDARLDLATLLRGASAVLTTALVAIYVEGHRVADVARRLGVSRFRIGREIKAFV